jgi:hypothetical protein
MFRDARTDLEEGEGGRGDAIQVHDGGHSADGPPKCGGRLGRMCEFAGV